MNATGNPLQRRRSAVFASDDAVLWAGVLGVCVLLGLFARTVDLGRSGLWIDEGWSLWFATRAGLADFLQENHPPLYYGLLRAVASVASSDAALRASGTLASVGTMAASFALARRVLGSRNAAFGVAALVAVAGVDIAVARELRMYPWMTLAFAACLLFGHRAATEGRRRDFAGFTATAIVLLYLHGIGAFFVAGALLFALPFASDRRRAMALVGAAALAGLAVLPWMIASTLHRMDLMSGGLAWRAPPTLGEILQTPLRLFVDTAPPAPGRAGSLHECGLALDPGLCAVAGFSERLAVGKLPLLAFAALGLAAAAVGLVRHARRDRRALLALAAAAIVPGVLMVAMARFAAPFWDVRYLAPCVVPVALLLAAWGVGSGRAAGRIATLATIGLCALTSIALPQQGPPEQWREALEQLGRDRVAGEPVILNSLGQGTQLLFARYLPDPRGDAAVVALRDHVYDHYGGSACQPPAVECLSSLRLPKVGSPTVWMVRSTPLDVPRYPFFGALSQWLDTHLEVESVRQYQGVQVYRMRRRAPG